MNYWLQREYFINRLTNARVTTSRSGQRSTDLIKSDQILTNVLSLNIDGKIAKGSKSIANSTNDFFCSVGDK